MSEDVCTYDPKLQGEEDERGDPSSLSPLWCKAITLGDLAAQSGIDQTEAEFLQMSEFARDQFRSGWTSPERMADWLCDYAKQTGEIQWATLGFCAIPYGEDVMVLLSATDSTDGRDFRTHFGKHSKNRSRPRPPRIDTLLNRAVTAHQLNPKLNAVHSLIVPDDDNPWAAVVFGPADYMLGPQFELQREVISAGTRLAIKSQSKVLQPVEVRLYTFRSFKAAKEFRIIAQYCIDESERIGQECGV